MNEQNPHKPKMPYYRHILTVVVVELAVIGVVIAVFSFVLPSGKGTAPVPGSSVGFAIDERNVAGSSATEDLDDELNSEAYEYQMFILDKSENIVDKYLFEIGTQYSDAQGDPLLLLDENWKQRFSENLRLLRAECREVIDYEIEGVPPSCRVGHAEFVLGVQDFDAMAIKLDNGVDKVSGTEISASMDLMLSGAEHIDKANELFPF